MITLQDIRYVRLGTPDLEAAIAYATDIIGLQLVAREGTAAYFRSDTVAVRGDTRDHTLVYFAGDPADHSIGFDLQDPAALDAVAAALDQAERPVRHGTAAECETRRVTAMVLSSDPSGNKIEIVARPYHSGVRYFPARDAGISHFSHIGLKTTDPQRDEAFWTRICNARVSDWIGDSPLLRIATAHHSLALFPSPTPGVQHINHQVEDVDDVMKSYYFLKQKGVKILFGPGRHPLSGAIMLYFAGPDGMVYEYSMGVKHIQPDEEARYRPRQFPFEPATFCMWGAMPEFDGMAPRAKPAPLKAAEPSLKAVV